MLKNPLFRSLAVLLFAGLTSLHAEKRPNILFIFSDDHGYQAVSAYGSNRNKTPNIDRIANEGMRFENCFVTNSICGPSRAVILTGKHSHLNGFFRNGITFNGEQQTFPKLLQKAGYQTAVFGKWHLKSDPTGFDDYEVLIGQGPYYNPPMKVPGGQNDHIGYTTDIITDLTLEWLKEGRDPDKPFMLMSQHKAPHRNWQPAPRHLNLYDDVEMPEPETLWDDYSTRQSPASNQAMTISDHLSVRDLKLEAPNNLTPEQQKVWDAAYDPKNKAFEEANLEGKERTKWNYQRYVKDYLRCVTAVDENIGRLLAYLDETGLAENTIVIYSSDQGWYLGEHGWYDKRWMYEESLRTPLVARWPGTIKPGSVNSDIVSNLDFAQTFLDIAGAGEPPEPMQGHSLVPLFKGSTPDDWRKTFYYHYYEFPGAHSVAKHYGVRNDRYKLIHFYETDGGVWEFFDLKEDPNELNSLHDSADHQDLIGEMKTELTRLRKHYQVPDVDPVPPARQKRLRLVMI
ncbi:MAG: sulfatase [Verrucomicrobiota bacterium]